MCRCPAHVLGVGSVLRLLDMLIPQCWGACRTGVGAQAAACGRAIVASRVCGNPVCKHLDSLQATTVAQSDLSAASLGGCGACVQAL